MPQPVQNPMTILNNEKKLSRVASNRAKQAISSISQGSSRKKQTNVTDENRVTAENTQLDSWSTVPQQKEIEDNKLKKRASRKVTKNESAPLTQRKESDCNQQDMQRYDDQIEQSDLKTIQRQSTDSSTASRKAVNESVETKEFIPHEPTERLLKDRKEQKGPTIGQVLRMRSLKPAEKNNHSNMSKEKLQGTAKLSEEMPQQNLDAAQSHSDSTAATVQQAETKMENNVTVQQKEFAEYEYSSSNTSQLTIQNDNVSSNDITNSGKFKCSEKKLKSTKGCKDIKETSKQKETVPSAKVFPERYPWEQPGYADGVGMPQALNEEELTKEFADWTCILQNLTNAWNYRAATLKRIRIAIAKPFLNECSKLAEIFSNELLTNALITQTTDLRSTLVKEAFETIAVVSEKFGAYNNFWFVAASFLEKACLVSVVRTTKVIAVPAEECGYRIVASTPAEAVLPVLCSTIRFGSHPVAREKATNYLLKILKRGRPLIQHSESVNDLIQKEDLCREDSDKTKTCSYVISEFATEADALECLKDVVTSAIGDSQGKTREAGLSCLHEMKCHWHDYTWGLLESLDPSLQRRAVNSLATNSDLPGITKQNKDRKTVKELKAEAQQTANQSSSSSLLSNRLEGVDETLLSSAISEVRIDVDRKTNTNTSNVRKNNCDNLLSNQKAGNNKSQVTGCSTRNLRSRTIPKQSD